MDWLNTDWKRYIEKKEKVIMHEVCDENYARIASIIGALFLSLVFSFILGVWFAMIVDIANDFNLGILIGFPIIYIIVYLISHKLLRLSYLSKHFVLTARGVYAITGLLNKHVKFVSYKQITDVDISVGIIDSCFKTGSVGISTASGEVVGNSEHMTSVPELSVAHVKNYMKIKQVIQKNIH